MAPAGFRCKQILRACNRKRAGIVLCGFYCCMRDSTVVCYLCCSQMGAVVAQTMRTRWWTAGTWYNGRRCGSRTRLPRRPCLAPMQRNTCLPHPGERHPQCPTCSTCMQRRQRAYYTFCGHHASCLMMTAVQLQRLRSKMSGLPHRAIHKLALHIFVV